MTKRESIFAVAGVLIIAAAFAGRTVLLRATQVEWPTSPSWFAGYADSSRGPKVIVWYDSPHWRIGNAVRIDVRQGVPHTRTEDGMPIRDLVSYIDAEVARTGAHYVVVSVSSKEKIGSVVSVLDECRKARIKVVVLNGYMDAFARK